MIQKQFREAKWRSKQAQFTYALNRKYAQEAVIYGM